MSSQPRSSISSPTLLPLWALRGCPSLQPEPCAAWAPENLLHVSLEERGSARTLHGKRWSHPFGAHARKHGGVSSAIASYRPMCPLTLRCPGIQSRQRDVRAHLINEDKPLGLHLLGDHHFAGRSEELLAFQRPHTPFFERSQAAS